MCVIIHKPAGVEFPEADVRTAFEVNSDGFGWMYYDPELDKIVAKKSASLKEDQIVALFKKLVPYEACFHFRFKTHGTVNNEQCHPFKVTAKERHGDDIYFMHNGVLNDCTKDSTKDLSDTQVFNNQFLKVILRRKPSLLKTTAIQKLIEKYIGAGNKLCFMFGKGEVVKVNAQAGSTRAGCWVSNLYSFDSGHRKSKGSSYTQTNYSNAYPYNQHGSSWKDRTSTLCGKSIKQDDEVYVFDKEDNNFLALGTVSNISHNGNITVKYEQERQYTTGQTYISTMYKTFKKESGEPETTYMYGTNAEASLWITPMFDSAKQASDNVVPFDTDKEGDKKKTEEEDAKKEENQDLSQQQELSVNSSEQADNGKESIDTEADQANWVTCGNLSVDASLRWGGELLSPDSDSYSLDADADGKHDTVMTVKEFVKLPALERLQIFAADPETCFNIFQDCAEYYVNMEFGIEEEAEEDSYSDTQEQMMLACAHGGC